MTEPRDALAERLCVCHPHEFENMGCLCDSSDAAMKARAYFAEKMLTEDEMALLAAHTFYFKTSPKDVPPVMKEEWWDVARALLAALKEALYES